MNSLSRILSVAALGAAVVFSSLSVSAQDANGDNNGGGRRNRGGGQGGPGGGGNWDPAQMRQRMMERMREEFDVKDDTEWKLISERIEKVNDARRETAGRGMGMMFGGGGRGGGQGGGGGGRGGFGGEPMPEQDALQKAVESNAPADETTGMKRKRYAWMALASIPLLLALAAIGTVVHAETTGQFLGFLPSGARTTIEQALDVPSAAPGEGTKVEVRLPLPESRST